MHILLVEDNPGDADLIIEQLDGHGDHEFQVSTVGCLRDAVAALTEFTPDIILLDLNMPDSTGLDTVRTMRRHAADLPIVVLTGVRDPDTGLAAIAQGAQDFVVKGLITPEGLLRALYHALQRHQAALRVQRSEQFLRATLDSLPANIAILDETGAIVQVNRAWRAFAEANGLPPDTQWEGMDYFAASDTDGLGGAIAKDIRKMLAGDSALVDIEYPCDSPTESRWFRCTATRFQWDGPPRVVVAHENITRRKEAEQQRDLQSAALNAADNAIAIFDRSGRLEWANPAFCALTQYTLDEAVGKNPRDLVKSGFQDEAFYRAMWDTVLQGEVWKGSLINRRKDGSLYTEEQTISPVRNSGGDITHFIAVKQDISERIYNEKMLREAREKLERAISAGNVGLWEYDLITGRAEYSPEWCSHLGCNPGHLTGTIEDCLSRVHPDDASMMRRLMAKPAAFMHPSTTIEMRMEHADGTYRWMLVKLSLVSAADGHPMRIIGANVEITEIKRLQEEFNQAQKMESIGRLAGGVAHDFNNILGVIAGYSEMILADLEEENPMRADIAEIKLAADRAANLTRQLLAFSRRQLLRPEVLDLNRVISGAEKMLRRLIGEDIAFELHLDDGLGSVMADPGQVEQVLLNLAVNARDAMPRGGRLIIETSNTDIDADFVRHHPEVVAGRFVRLTVSDTGEGMDRNTLERIFDPFFTTKEQGKGTGLGLATVYGIVKQSTGLIVPYSEPGHGTTFNIYLPRLEAPTAERQDNEAAALAPGNETILLVEDEDALRQFAERALVEAGYTVHAASNGREALTLAALLRTPPQLLLTDVVMPEMGGRDCADRLLARHPGLKVIYMSGYTDEVISHHGVLNAGVHFINKPFTRPQITRKIREVLDTR